MSTRVRRWQVTLLVLLPLLLQASGVRAVEPPAAVAGEDIAVTDGDGDGEEKVHLDACASRPAHPRRPIRTYAWLENPGPRIRESRECRSAFTFPVGTHDLALVVRDAPRDRTAIDFAPYGLLLFGSSWNPSGLDLDFDAGSGGWTVEGGDAHVVARLADGSPPSLELSFRTSDGAQRTAQWQAQAGDAFRIERALLDAKSGWSGVIQGLTLALPAASGRSTEIDFIRLVGASDAAAAR